jgi:hypothetical protein
MELQFKEITKIYGSHIDHIWTNAPIQQCMSRVVEAYWTNHKPINFAFKLPYYVPQYHHIDFFFNQKYISNNNKAKIIMKG